VNASLKTGRGMVKTILWTQNSSPSAERRVRSASLKSNEQNNFSVSSNKGDTKDVP